MMLLLVRLRVQKGILSLRDNEKEILKDFFFFHEGK
jgi:hypothetical protein